MNSRTHAYDVSVAWEGNRGEGTAAYARYGRQFRLQVGGKPDLLGSADAAFCGDPGLHDPEDLLVGAVAACHMLVYLALCAKREVRVTAYADGAHGVMETSSDGGGAFREIRLRPRVRVAKGSDVALALELHTRAHELCFVARSCNFPIHHEATIDIEGGAT
jgi:organic hydroperoxide reductase OsmC/OhrA